MQLSLMKLYITTVKIDLCYVLLEFILPKAITINLYGTNQQMENQGRPSLAMFISDDKISDTNIDEFLASFDPDKYRIFHDPRYKFLPLVCRTHCDPYSLFNIDNKFKPDEKDKIFFSIPTDDIDFYKSFYLNKDYIEGIYPN